MLNASASWYSRLTRWLLSHPNLQQVSDSSLLNPRQIYGKLMIPYKQNTDAWTLAQLFKVDQINECPFTGKPTVSLHGLENLGKDTYKLAGNLPCHHDLIALSHGCLSIFVVR